MKVFIDTSAFYAIVDKDDANHETASEIINKLVGEKAELYTSNFILSETYTLLRNNVGHSKTIDFIEKARDSLRIIHISEDIEERAIRILKKYSDKDFSFVDCTSFVIIEDLKFQKTFAFDKHFKQYGLATLS